MVTHWMFRNPPSRLSRPWAVPQSTPSPPLTRAGPPSSGSRVPGLGEGAGTSQAQLCWVLFRDKPGVLPRPGAARAQETV